jgi:hypothetical protein
MAECVAFDGTRLLIYTRSALVEGVGTVQYGRVVELRDNTMSPEAYMDRLRFHGRWEALDTPVPADALLAQAKPAVLPSPARTTEATTEGTDEPTPTPA